MVNAITLLNNPSLAEAYQNILVVGGGAVGCETAYFLAAEMNKQVTLIEMLPFIMKGLCTANRGHMIRLLEKSGVRLLNCTKLLSIEKEQIRVHQNISTSVPNPYNTWNPLLPENVENPLEKPIKEEFIEKTLPAGLIVLANGLQPDEELFRTLQQDPIKGDLYCIGDNFRIGSVFQAVKAGYAVGSTI